MSRYSKSQVKRAGKKLRRYAQDNTSVPMNEIAQAIKIVDYWRAEHSTPLLKARMGLQSRCNTVNVSAQISQRLKRVPTIIDKLGRQPKNQLTMMQDIAGCRAVVTAPDDLVTVQRQWGKTGSELLVKTDDYMQTPKPSGYRGVHLVVRYDNRRVEVQLRTQLQHAWGVAVESAGGVLGIDLKSGRGPTEALTLLHHLAELLAAEDNLPADPPSRSEFIRAAKKAPTRLLSAIGLEVHANSVAIAMPER